MTKEKQNKNRQKKEYSPPKIETKEMTGTFLICAQNAAQCPPGSSIKKLGTCF